MDNEKYITIKELALLKGVSTRAIRLSLKILLSSMLDSIEKQEIHPRELDDLMLAQEIKTITSQGIRFLKSDYYNDALYGLRQKVIIKYSLFDLSYINVYTISGKFLCRAERITLTHLTPIIKNMIILKHPLNTILTGSEQQKKSLKRKIRNDFYKIKQELGLTNYIFDDLRYSSNIDN